MKLKKGKVITFFAGGLVVAGVVIAGIIGMSEKTRAAGAVVNTRAAGEAADMRAAGEISIDFPKDRGIYQRNYDNVSDMFVSTVYDGEGTVKARIMNGTDLISDWTELDKTGDTVYSGVIEAVPAGGWYQLEAAVFDASGAQVSAASLEHIGVGEVFITGGQSNSCNFGGAKTASVYDTVSAYDAARDEWQHCEDSQPDNSGYATGNGGGSPWPTLGDELAYELGVPIGFCTTGFGNTRMDQLCTERYAAIKEAITGLSKYGYRAFLIHQGEADTDVTPMDEYRASLQKLIEMTRNDAGYDLTWMIAQVSYAWSGYNNTEKMEAIKETQRSVCNDYDIFEGPTTDDLQGDYRYTDNLHLSEKGLVEHGKRWADAIMTKLFTKYQLNADSSVTHGKIIQCGDSYYAGEDIKLTAQPDEGYRLVPGSFKVVGSEGEIELADDSFKMRAQDLTVTAEFEKLPPNPQEQGNKPGDTQTPGVASPGSSQAPGTANGTASPGAQGAGTQGTGAQGVDDTAAPETFTAGGLVYKIVESKSGRAACVTGIKNKNAASVTIPKSVAVNGSRYKVVSIAKKAFAKAKKLKKVVIKSTYIKSIGKNAFAKTNAKLKIKVPAKKLIAYKKLIKKSGYKKLSGVVK